MSKTVSNNPRKFLGALKIRPTEYQKLYNEGKRVTAFLLAEIATFPTPSPTLVSANANLLSLKNAIAKNGTKFNRASKVNNTDCRSKADIVRNDLLQLLQYVVNTVGDLSLLNPSAVPVYASSGLAFKNIYSRTNKKLQTIRNVKVIFSQNFMAGEVKWKKPLGLIKGKQVPSYAIFQLTGTGIDTSGNYLATVTKCRYELPNSLLTRPSQVRLMILPQDTNGFGQPFIIAV